jgi:hypothetical protein
MQAGRPHRLRTGQCVTKGLADDIPSDPLQQSTGPRQATRYICLLQTSVYTHPPRRFTAYSRSGYTWDVSPTELTPSARPARGRIICVRKAQRAWPMTLSASYLPTQRVLLTDRLGCVLQAGAHSGPRGGDV